MQAFRDLNAGSVCLCQHLSTNTSLQESDEVGHRPSKVSTCPHAPKAAFLHKAFVVQRVLMLSLCFSLKVC
jgi:hypothetical protein